jgi:hypothetical protein
MYGSLEKHYLQVSKATEFETIKRLPKFGHAKGAVINPIHSVSPSKSPSRSPSRGRSKSPSRSPSREPRLKLVGSPVRYHINESVTRVLPEHLIRPPPEVFYESKMKERSIGDVIRRKELKLGRKLSTKEKQDLAEKEKNREEMRKKLEIVRANSKLFFREWQLKLEEINLKGEKPSLFTKGFAAKSMISKLFSVNLKGIKKLYNELMGKKIQKLTKSKFLEFAKKVTDGKKLTDTVLKELFNFYCKKNKKQGGKAMKVKVSLNL